MKNREKFPKTDDAIKAYEIHKKECKCNCTFDEWLDTDEDAAKEEIASILAGLATGAIFAPLFIKDKLRDRKEEIDEQADVEVGNLGKCPVCGGDKVKCHRDLIWRIECPDCGLFFGVDVKSHKKKEHDEALIANWRKLQGNIKK